MKSTPTHSVRVSTIRPSLSSEIAMKVIQTLPVEISLRTLGPQDLQEVLTWIDHLKNWENDATLRSYAKRLNSSDNVYVLRTTGEFRIFFRLEQDQIVLLDLATKATLQAFARTSESARR